MKKAVLIIILCLFFIFKLNYQYFFTDEILYVDAGREYLLKRDFSMNLQHPLVAKYIAGIASIPDDRNVFLMRVPFALMAVLCAITVYKILKENVSELAGIFGALMFAIMPYIYSASRMVMMESPMHLFWLLYSLYFFRLLKDFDKKNAIFSGVFLGLSIATKFNSAVLIPVSLFILGLQFIKSRNEKIIWSVFYITGAAIVCFGITYIPLLLAEGTNGIINTIRAIKDVLLERNSEGKIHVVNDQLFQTSPWWFYLYYIYKEYSIITILVAITGICYAIYKKSTFSLYWLLLLLINVMFFQALTLKNARYISTMEVSLVILIGIFISDIYKKYPRITFVLVVIMLSMRIFSLLNMKPNSYNALYLKMKDETSNFKTQDRIYIFGSIRTSRWYFDGLPEDLVISRKDFDVMSAEFPNFKYIAIDPVEEIKNPNNLLTQYIKLNEAKYAYMDLNGINLYTRK